MKTIFKNTGIAAWALACFLITAGASEKPASSEAQKETKQPAAIPSELLALPPENDALPDEAIPPSTPSVNLKGELKFEPRQNIDSFLGDFENPYAADESTYKGSRSEFRGEDGRMDRT